MSDTVCGCGQPIAGENILAYAYHRRVFAPHLIWFKFQCQSCGNVSPQIAKQETWEQSFGRSVPESLCMGTSGMGTSGIEDRP